MDAERFDSMARSLASRLSRRTALRGTGAGVAAGVLAALQSGTARAAVARQDAASPYVVVRTYQAPADLASLQQTLGQGYAPQLAQQPGFIEYTVLGNEGGVTTISAFTTPNAEEAATNQLANWVNQNLANLLPELITTINDTAIVHVANQAVFCPAPPSGPTPTAAAPTAAAPTATAAAPTATAAAPTATASAPTATAAAPTATAPAPTATAAAPTATALPVCTDPSRPGVGCACSTGTQNPCGDTTLVCCANDPNAAPGAPGTCTPSSVGCQPLGPTPTLEPSPTPPTPCTGIGCPCTAGVEGTCDAGLVCCQSQMGGDNVPGGPGMCAAADACGDGGAPDASPAP
jgi:hypothetical protein